MPYLLLILTTLFWSGNLVLSRGMHTAIPPLALSFWRWALALFLLLIITRRHFGTQWPVLRRHWRYIVVQGLLGVSGFTILLYLAVHYTTVINAGLVNSCTPVLIVLFSWLLYRETVLPRQWCGVLFSLAGVLWTMAKGEMTVLRQVSMNQGDLLVLAAAVIWALYSSRLKRYPQGLHPLVYLTSISGIGLITILPFYLAEIQTGKSIELNPATVFTVIYMALFASVAAFIFWNAAVRAVGPAKASPFVHLIPVFSIVLAVVFLGEPLSWYHAQGAVLIFSGIFMTTFHFRRMRML
ncbi:MAG: DMT family transporter [Desulfobulbus sp.]|nr:DMT family transporter [Desulfobulbus sp.]